STRKAEASSSVSMPPTAGGSWSLPVVSRYVTVPGRWLVRWATAAEPVTRIRLLPRQRPRVLVREVVVPPHRGVGRSTLQIRTQVAGGQRLPLLHQLCRAALEDDTSSVVSGPGTRSMRWSAWAITA